MTRERRRATDADRRERARRDERGAARERAARRHRERAASRARVRRVRGEGGESPKPTRIAERRSEGRHLRRGAALI